MRKKRAPKRYVQPDPKFGDIMVTQFVNRLMYSGKKSVAYGIFYGALGLIEERTKEPGMDIWKKAIQNVGPSVEVKTRRIGGANFQIPTEVRGDRKASVAMKWLIQYSRERNGKSMADKLATEIVAASKGEGGAFKKKEDTHKMAEANKAFAHFKF
ncbi:MAG TPA: 30S ribosomal protein S7 [Chitinophagales bacterium]|nr:30S ribosomal protein S7 [Chitinophagales bacterium]